MSFFNIVWSCTSILLYSSLASGQPSTWTLPQLAPQPGQAQPSPSPLFLLLLPNAMNGIAFEQKLLDLHPYSPKPNHHAGLLSHAPAPPLQAPKTNYTPTPDKPCSTPAAISNLGQRGTCHADSRVCAIKVSCHPSNPRTCSRGKASPPTGSDELATSMITPSKHALAFPGQQCSLTTPSRILQWHSARTTMQWRQATLLPPRFRARHRTPAGSLGNHPAVTYAACVSPGFQLA
jgi:hypothetical protein